MRVLFIDIETSPHETYSWGLYNQNLSIAQVKKPGRVLCFAAKFQGEKRMRFHAEWQEGGSDGMIIAARSLFDEADVVVHYNGDGFDIPWLKGEMLVRHLPPYSPFRSVDLYKEMKKFTLVSRKLAWVAPALGMESKLEAGGMSTWIGVLDGKRKAQNKMRRYNIQDVVVLEQVHNILRPWIRNYPNPALYNEALDGQLICRCGSENVQRRGYYHTNVARRQRYVCLDCHAWSTGGPLLGKVELRGV